MAWLYVPGLEALSSDSASASETPIDVWATSSGKPMPRPSLWRGWRTRPWIGRLSGTTSRPSTAARGAAAWISSLPASPASLPAPLAAGAAPATSDGCGPTSRAWSAQLLLDWSSSRTSRDSSPSTVEPPSTRLWRIYPRSGSMRSGTCSRRPRSGHPSFGSGSSCWPTATAEDAAASGSATYSTESGRHPGTTLTDAIRMWPSPDASAVSDRETPASWLRRREANKAKRYNGNGQGTPLSIAAVLWPTPVAAHGDGASDTYSLRDGNLCLLGAARIWATPQCRDPKGAFSRHSKGGEDLSHLVLGHATNGPASSPRSRSSRRRLNPAFVEWLMGWPTGWSIVRTGSGCSATEWYRWLRQSRSVLSQLVPAWTSPPDMAMPEPRWEIPA